MYTIPNNSEWSQKGDSDLFGSLYASTNLDLSENDGKVRIAKRLLVNTATADLADITSYPIGFWLCGTAIHTFVGSANVGYDLDNDGTLTGAFARETAGTEPVCCDSTTTGAVFSNNALYCMTGQPTSLGFYSFYKKIGNGNWAKTDVSETNSNYPISMCSFQSRTYATVTQSKVISWDTADSVSTSGTYTIILNGITADFANVITKLLPTSDKIWILTVNTTGGPGFAYEWDGASTSISAGGKKPLTASGALAGCVYGDVPYIMDSNGNLQAWNGGTFKTVASLWRKSAKLLYNPLSLVNNRFIHPNGMQVVDNKILINIDNRNYDNTSSIEDTITAGMYEFDPANPTRGLVHKYSFGRTKSGGTISDYGGLRIAGAGGIAELNLPSTSSSRNGTLIAGAGFYTDATTSTFGIFYDDSNDTLQKAGSFITTKIQSANVQDRFEKLFVQHRRLINSTDKYVVKYRITEEDPVEATITWTSTTTFTVANSAVVVSNYWTSGTGGEVEVVHGIGANKCSHITNAVNNAGTWTVTVDETYTGATSGTSKARFGKWTKIGSMTDQTIDFKRFSVEKDSSWIQFKVWALFTGPNEFQRLFLTNKSPAASTQL